MPELRPAHEALVHLIQQHHSNICGAEKLMSTSPVVNCGRIVPIGELQLCRAQEIGAFCALIDALDGMIIPEDKLDSVVEELRSLNYNHAHLHRVIENLEARKPKAPDSSATLQPNA